MSNLTENSTSLAVAENSVPTPIGIATPIDDSYGTSALSVTVTEMPSDSAVLLADGVHPVTRGESLTVGQLTGLAFQPTLNAASLTSTFGFNVLDPSGNTTSAAATLAIGSSTTPLLTTWTSLTEAQNGLATPLGIATPVDINFPSSGPDPVQITALPADGAVLLSDGTTRVTVGEMVDGGATHRAPVSAGSGPTLTSDISPFTYTVTVSDPCGASAKGGRASLPIEGDFDDQRRRFWGRSGIR
jgi:hypothetical protein